MSTSRIGLVGLGLMGSAIAERALAAGYSVLGFDVRHSRLRVLKRLGGQPANSVREIAATCGKIVLSLPTTRTVEAVVGGFGNELRSGSRIIDTTTGDPERTVVIGKRLAAKRVSYVDATIAGSSAQTRSGEVIVLAGGTARSVRSCRSFLTCFAKRVFHVGPIGSGARAKLVVNLALGLNRAVLAEAIGFARAIGVPPRVAMEVLKAGPAFSRVMETKGQKMLEGDFSAEAKLSQHLKDVRLILALGKRSGAKLPLSALHRRLLKKLESAGFGELDNSAIAKFFERSSQ